MKKIAFIGTGLMGAPMAEHLLNAGYELSIYNRSKSQRALDLIEKGARWAQSPKEACQGAELILTIVGYPKDVEEVYFGDEGLIEHADKGAILVDMSTSSPELAREIAQAAEVRDLIAFDAPVTGGEDGAKAGTLTIMVGATEEQLALVHDVFKCFGELIVPFGAAGKGQLAKMTNQIAIAGAMQAMAESLAFAKTVGLDQSKVLPILQSGSAGSVALSLYAPRALEGNFEPGFKVEHLRKDLNIALGIAEEESLVLPGLEAAYGVYDLLYNINGASKGTQAITLVYDEEACGQAAGLDWSMLGEEFDEHFENLEEASFGFEIDDEAEEDDFETHHEHGRAYAHGQHDGGHHHHGHHHGHHEGCCGGKHHGQHGGHHEDGSCSCGCSH